MKKIGLISPCSNLDAKAKKNIALAKEYLQSLGFEVVLGKHIFDKHLFMAGHDKDRANDIMEMYKDKDVVAIIATRGGSGGARLLKHLDFKIIKKNPKPFIGFSDITSIQNAIYKITKQVSFSGFMASHNFKTSKILPNAKKSFESLLKNKPFSIKSGKSLIDGEAKGELIGGNLIVFSTLFGTPYCPDFKNKIILIEDIDESTYAINRTLLHLKMQPNFDKVKGIIFADFNNCKPFRKSDGDLNTQIKDFAKDLNIPIITDFEYGHMDNGYVLPIGKRIKMISSKKECKITIS